MKKIGVLTSGGDAPGMNAAIRAVVRCGINAGLEVWGIERGYEGLLDRDIRKMELSSVGEILHRGGTLLKTARSERFRDPVWIDKAAEFLKEEGIEGLVVIGGDGSMRGGLELAQRGIKIMGVPGTIDNDLAYTDFTIGFDTAVSTVLDAIGKIRDTSSAHNRTTVIEVMGRHCGDIALYAAMTGGAEFVLLPEKKDDIDLLCEKIIEGSNRGKLHSIIIKAEGTETNSEDLIKIIEERTGKETKYVILSYLQRGGSPTMNDRMLATLCGAKAVELLAEGEGNKAIGTVSGKVVAFDIEEALAMKNTFNEEMYRLIDVLSK
ncbi:MAG: 6-phosphofructokinase [Firmicutes bacterium]|nr:6-phosphofructokinase [Bacillota bacterium]